MLRVATSVLIAGGVTFGLFTLMRLLVTMTEMQLDEYDKRKVIDFVRLKRDSRTVTKRRELPTRAKAEKPPEAPKMKMTSNAAPGASAVAVAAPSIDTKLDLGAGLQLGAAPADTDSVPVVRVDPIYPRAAADQFIEGWVTLQFDITTTGATSNVRAIAANPKGVFEKAAEQAVRKWKYKPKVYDGVARVTKGVKVRLKFELD